MPRGYFDLAASEVLRDFRQRALICPSEDLTADFPEARVAHTLRRTWEVTATRLYRNWLNYVASRTTDTSLCPASVRAQPSLKAMAPQ